MFTSSDNPAILVHRLVRKRTVSLHFVVWHLLLVLSSSEITPCHAASPFRSRHWWGIHRGGSSSTSSPLVPSIEAAATETTTIPSSLAENSLTGEEQVQTNSIVTALNTTSNETVKSVKEDDNNTGTSNVTSAIIPEWKRRLPAPLCHKTKTLQRICIPHQNNVVEIYLLGTAHVSNDSSRDVQLLLETIHPQVIFVELCSQRTALLEDPPPDVLQHHSNHNSTNNETSKTPFWEQVEQVQMSQPNTSKMQAVATVLLTSTQEDYAKSLGVELGGEFRVAHRYWRSLPPRGMINNVNYNLQQSLLRPRPHLVLGDRPLALTLARSWESLGLWGKFKVMVGLIFSTFHKPSPEELRKWIQSILEDDEKDLLTSSLEDLKRHFPTLERVIIRERDAYMACKLNQLSRGMLLAASRTTTSTSSGAAADETPPPIVIAALVGAGHVSGICEWLARDNHTQTPEEILAGLVATNKFKHEDMTSLIEEVTEVQDMVEEKWTWTESHPAREFQ